MQSSLSTHLDRINRICRGQPEDLAAWLEPDRHAFRTLIPWIVIGGGLYGATLGCWQAGTLQPLYVAIKFPLLILLVALGNTLINGMLAQLLGLSLTFQQTLRAVVMSFALACLILASLAPVNLFMVWNTPPPGTEAARIGHSIIILVQVTVIALAGGLAHLRLYRLLRHLTGSTRKALQCLFAWLGGNLLLGSQLSWILRPFFGAPHLKVQFLRPNAFSGSFFEDIIHQLNILLGNI